MRIIFFAGKGGVGKTSVAAATGINAAEKGNRTIILSLDVAHSLSDIFDLDRDLLNQNKGKPVEVGQNLWIQELDVSEEIERNWGEVYRYISTFLNTTGLDETLAEELAVLPGMEEVSLLLYINHYVKTNKFDVIILDCAPTGESLRFISFPTTLDWYIKKIFKLEKRIVKYVRPIANRLTDIPMPGDTYFEAVERLSERLRGVDEVLCDPEITTVRLVTNPEKIVLKETQRAFMIFCLFKMSIDGIIINRIIPGDVKDSYFKDWHGSQRRHIRDAEKYFNPVPIFHVNLFHNEIVGYDRLKALSDQLYGERNPVERFFHGKPFQLSKQNGGYELTMKLPFVLKKDLELNKISDELIVRVGSFKRHMLLPRKVAAAENIVARLEDQDLHIHFKGVDDGKT